MEGRKRGAEDRAEHQGPAAVPLSPDGDPKWPQGRWVWIWPSSPHSLWIGPLPLG